MALRELAVRLGACEARMRVSTLYRQPVANGGIGLPRAPGLRSGVRSFLATPARYGVMDSMRSAYDTAMGSAGDQREQRVFEAQLSMLTDRERDFDGNRFLDFLAAMKEAGGMSGFKEHLPWVQNNPALGELKEQQAIVYAMSPSERKDINTIRIGAKKRIARSAEQSVDAVDAVLTQIETMSSLRRWLLGREDSGLPMPTSGKQMQAMVLAPGSGMSRKRVNAPTPAGMRPGIKKGRR